MAAVWRLADVLTAAELRAWARGEPSPTSLLLSRICGAGLPRPVREYRFHPRRRWRLDLAWPDRRVAAEVEGGIWTRGRHVRPRGYEEDCLKYAEAVLCGWRLLRFTPGLIQDGHALSLLARALGTPLASAA